MAQFCVTNDYDLFPHLAGKVKYNFDDEEEIKSDNEEEAMEVNGPTSKSDDESFKVSGSENDEELEAKKKPK